MTASSRPKILCVDDEPKVLEGLELNLGRRFETVTAPSGAEALEIVERCGPFAAVLSDMRMPGMNGAEFLAAVRRIAPETVRLLLTGQTDLNSAVKAVNEGQIFRFLTKPCSPTALIAALDSAVEQYRLVTAERELLEQTLVGTLQMLNDVLALANPEAFGRATRIREYVVESAAALDIPDRWQVEAAAMLSQIGYITLNSDTVAKLNRGKSLTPEEERLAARIPQVNEQLLGKIPRLDGVRAIIAAIDRPHADRAAAEPNSAGSPVELGSRLLRVAIDFDRLDREGMSAGDAIEAMMSRRNTYDRRILETFGRLRMQESASTGVHEMPLSAVRPGMVFMEDVVMRSGILLAARGYLVTAAFVERARNFEPRMVVEPVRCLLKNSAEDSSGQGPRAAEKGKSLAA